MEILGFMFGNVDKDGDLDVDYFDEDSKQHIVELGLSLMSDIDTDTIPADVTEEDYDHVKKAEDAIDYEDIDDEQYEEIPEIIQQPTFQEEEEDYLLPKSQYFSAQLSLDSLGQRNSVFDQENYDEDDDFDKVEKAVDGNLEAQSSPGKVFEEEMSYKNGKLAVALEDSQDEQEDLQETLSEKSMSALPVLYIGDRTVVLHFSEIFGIHEPIKKGEKRSSGYPIFKGMLKFLGLTREARPYFRDSLFRWKASAMTCRIVSEPKQFELSICFL
ncbi:hypothetical protein AQUCO_04000117v1 [Aquilegia coerulea]|uniref:TAFII-230 TBP-binding domain-containing protein n=1 Tax=Aquilegia coerulea TaxID=218851 RepID=A0A2G5CR95_AQUCA|nr:hypothetical protein AQUCO_04000117v1 [Aquilegia coerulea]